jgi:HAD superfamily hydrolase (TIGR01490 family)
MQTTFLIQDNRYMAFSNKFKYIAFYDLDHTILKGNSATSLVEESRKRGIMSPKQFRNALLLSIVYKLNLGNPTKMIIRMLLWLKGIEETTFKELCNDVFKGQLLNSIRPEMLQTMEEHRKEGGAVVLLSSATAPICAPIAAHLKMDEVICTHLESVNGVLTGHAIGKLVYGKEKTVQLLAFCNSHHYNPNEAYYYGDSYSDHHVMEAVGNPVAVSPEKGLLKIATARNWYILPLDR